MPEVPLQQLEMQNFKIAEVNSIEYVDIFVVSFKKDSYHVDLEEFHGYTSGNCGIV